MRRKHKKLLVLGLFVALSACFYMAFPASKTEAAINPQINFQGKLTNPDGTNVTDGTYSIRFRIYTDPTADAASVCTPGTTTCKWEETQASVAVSSGIFQVSLGSSTALPGSVNFNAAGLYLGVKVGSDAEMTPRITFTASPYAFNADQLDGLDSSGFIQLGPGSVQNDATTNPSVFLNKTAATGNIIQLKKNGTDVFTVANSGATTLNNTLTVQSNAYTANQVFLNNGLSSPLPTIPGGFLPTLTVRNSQTASSRPLFFGYDDTTGTGWASYLTAGACGSYVTMCLDFGTGTTTMAALENSGTTLNVGGGDDGNFTNVQFKNSGSVIVGSQTTDGAQVLFQVDSLNTFADTATCGTGTNQGAMYYSTFSGAMRACVNGSWEDMVSTGGLGILAFGVIADSANAGTPGDIAGVSNYSNSPCKVVWTALQQVTVEPCTVFSGGRKLIIPATPLSTAALAANTFSNICISTAAGGITTTGLPVLLTGSTTETSATLPAFSVNNPVACFATVKTSATAGNVGFIWDTRTFTNTQKQFATINSVNNNGFMVVGTTTLGVSQTVNTAAQPSIRGVVTATTGTASATAVNAIIATNGPAFVKFVSGTTATINACLQTTTTAGYGVGSAACTIAITGYGLGGPLQSSISTSCTTTNTVLSACQYSPLVDFRPSR